MWPFKSGKRHFWRRTGGVSAVEFALLLPVLMWILCGVIDFGNIFFQLSVVNEAAREGARIAATLKTGNPAAPPTQASVQSTLRTEFPNNNNVGQLNLTLNYNSPAAGAVTASVARSVNILTPVINKILNEGSITVTGNSVMKVE